GGGGGGGGAGGGGGGVPPREGRRLPPVPAGRLPAPARPARDEVRPDRAGCLPGVPGPRPAQQRPGRRDAARPGPAANDKSRLIANKDWLITAQHAARTLRGSRTAK